jgi:Bacterial Ig-like domain (group 1)/Invasin, domain 3
MQPSLQGLYTTPTGLVTANPPQIFVGAGDIASCGNNNDEATAKLLDAVPDPATVYLLGDDAYDNGTTSEFANCYDPTWGRHKYRTKPSAGNHEYNTSGATPYYAYFGAAAGPSGLGYYSYNLGAWHIIVLNSNISRSAGSAQDTWLLNDLTAHPNQCTLAYWHHPLYSSTGGSGSGGASIASMKPFWDRLYAAHADLILNGHRHFYERLAPMKPDGSADPTNGVREIIVGSGGIGGGSETNLFPTHQVGDGSTFGVLKLYLYDDSYAWKFIPVAGKTFTDSGSTACHSSSGGGGGGGGGVSASQSTVSAAPTSFTAGSGSSTITVTAKDGNGSTISGASVVFASTGSGNTFTPPTATTNGSGVATSTFTSSVAQGKTVSVTIDGTPITQTAAVSVTSGGGGGGGGTVTQALLTSGADGTNQKVYTSTSISPAANALVTVAVLGRRSGGAMTPTVTGGGMASWTQVASVDFDPVSGSTERLAVFRAMSAAPGSGPVTITYSSSQSNVQWMVSQWTGVDQSGTNGSGAIGQTGSTNGNSVTSLSTSLGAFANANNVGFGLIGAATNGPAVTPGAGFTEIGATTTGESTLLEAEQATNLNGVAASLSKSVNAGLLALEIKAGTPSGPTVSPTNSTVAAAPGSIVAGGSGSTITVTAKDGSGNPISGATVVLAATGTGNTLTQPAGPTNASGVATGTLTSTVAEPKTVSATINTVAITQQPSVTVAPAAAAALAFTTQPSNTQANAPIAPAVVVEIRDPYGNRVNSSANVSMTIGTNPSSGNLTGNSPQAAVAGVATFSALAIDQTGNGYTLSASSTGLTSATSAGFNITAPAPSAALSTVVAGTPSFTAGGASAITVTVKDGLGNPLSGVSVTLSSSVAGDVVTQPATATDGSGVTAGSVSATSAGPRTITAVAGAITLNQKPVLTVNAGAADAGTSTVGATPTTITAGSGSAAITVTVRDQYGNPVSGSAVVLSATPTTGNTLTGGGSTDANGAVTGALSSTTAELKTVSATADGVPITQTVGVTVTNQPPPGITQTLLTSGHDPANSKVYTTASIAPASNALVTIAVTTHQASAAAPSPVVTGGGMSSWVVVATAAYGGATPLDRVTVYRAMSASPGSGPITITSSATVSNCQWIVSQWSGVDPSGTNGAGAIGQTLAVSGEGVNGLTATLAAFGSASNVGYGVFGLTSNATDAAPGSGFAAIAQEPSGEGSTGDVFAEWAANRNVIGATWSSKSGGGLGVEIKAAP